MNKKAILSNFMWRLMERCGAQGVTLVVSIVLARILDPTIYGTIALVTVFTTILQVFVDSGLGNALIQKKDADDLDFSSVFYFNVVLCVLIYICMYLASPYIARFYGLPYLVPVIRVMSLTIVISGVKNVQQAYVSRHMLFKKFFFATLAGTIGAAVGGIWFAYKGAGIWALVFQNLFNLTIDTIILWITVPWRPVFAFSFKRLKVLFSYGWKLMASSLLETGYMQLRQLIIGKRYTTESLAYYNNGDKIPSLIITNVNTSINSVLFPSMSQVQDDNNRVKNMARRTIKISTYIMMPLLIGLAACAKQLVTLLLTEKWLPCVPYIQVFCITYMLYPIHTINLNSMKALGYSSIFLKLEIVKKIVGVIVLLVSVNYGVMAMACSYLVESILALLINSWPNRKLIDYGIEDQLRDMLPNIIISLAMGISVFGISLCFHSAALSLFVQIFTGVMIYLGLSVLSHNESYIYIFGLIKPLLKRK